jgi:hypothetical protein
MTKGKYSLSPEGMGNLMSKLTKIVQENDDSTVTGLMKAEVTSSFVRSIMKVKDLDDVIERNEQLSKSMVGFINMYGFESAYDMYVYSLSCNLYQIQKSKDYSKLVPVKRKIMRNGKETEVTVYEDPNKDNKDKEEGSDKAAGSQRASHARELPAKRHSRKSKSTDINPKEIAKLKLGSEGFGGKPFNDGSHHYLEINGPNGELVGVVGYSEEGEFMVMDFYRSNGEVSGVAARGFGELIQLATTKNKGVKVEDNPQARPVYVKFGLEQDGNSWSITAEQLQTSLGKGVAKENE